MKTSPKLPEHTLGKSRTLPLKPDPVILTGQRIRLEPLHLGQHLEALHSVSNGQEFQLGSSSHPAYDAEAVIWRYMSAGPFESSQALGVYLKGQVEAPNGLCLVVVDLETEHPIGVVNMMNNVPSSLKIELGSIWYGPIAQGRLVNTEATYLMLRHLFALGYRRVEWKCDSLNARSKKSALRNGFIYEGQQDCHFIVKGRNRDTSWFRMLDRDWAEARLGLEKSLQVSP